MKLNARHVIIFLLLILLSVAFAFGFDAAATAVERRQYPQPKELADSVKQASQEHGIPEAILWATLCTGSDFASNHVSDSGEIGLMQLTPAQFDFICTELWGKEPMDAGMLYDPDTNLQAGSAYLSYLYTRYGVWEQVFAAYASDTETVNAWLSDPAYVSPQGVLKDIPDARVAAYVKDMTQAVELYTKLYYQS